MTPKPSRKTVSDELHVLTDYVRELEQKVEHKMEAAVDYVKEKTERLSTNGPVHVSAEKRRQLIAEAAYFRAERRGFAQGGTEQDWLEAEAEVDRLLDVLARPENRAAEEPSAFTDG